jgi:uncharacterized membrane protein YdjX (TVP38/TMEM64 family)
MLNVNGVYISFFSLRRRENGLLMLNALCSLMKQKHRIRSYAILFLVMLSVFAIGFLIPDLKQFASPLYVRNLILTAGSWGYFLVEGLLLLSVPLPIPSSSVVLASGYVYGLLGGTIISLIGVLIGGSISFLLVRRFGMTLLEKFVDKHHIIHFNHLFKKRGMIIAFIAFTLPIFPDDTVMMLLGLTPIRYSVFLLIAFIGHIPRLLLINSIGSDFYKGFTPLTYVLIGISLAMILVAVFREKIKRFMFKELKEVEKDVKKEVIVLEKEVALVEKDVEKIDQKIGLKRKKKKKR